MFNIFCFKASLLQTTGPVKPNDKDEANKKYTAYQALTAKAQSANGRCDYTITTKRNNILSIMMHVTAAVRPSLTA